MERIIRKLLSYTWSHIYDIHAVIVSLIVLAVMFFVQKKLHNTLVRLVDEYFWKKSNWKGKREVYIRRSGLIYVVIIFFLSNVVFALAAFISPFINFSFQSAVMSFVYVLFEYAILRQLMYHSIRQSKGDDE